MTQLWRLRRVQFALGVVALLAVLALCSLFWPLSGEPSEAPRGLASTRDHWLGTDEAGRDSLAVLLRGSFNLGWMVVAVSGIALVVGGALGAAAGSLGRLSDALLARAVELSSTLPTLILLAVVRTWEGGGSGWAFVIVLGLSRAVELARLLRGQLLAHLGSDFVLAAEALGASRWRIFWHHLLPHSLGPVWVSLCFGAAQVVALDSALGFVGFPGDTPTWGTLLGQGRLQDAGSWTALLLASATALGLYGLGDTLDDCASPRRRRVLAGLSQHDSAL